MKIAYACDMSKERWRLLESKCLGPYMNLSIEEAILIAIEKGIAPNTVRLWRNSNAVVLGRFQQVASGVDLGACMRYDTAIVSIFTGGGAVYHDCGNINWTVVVNKDHPILSNGHLRIFESCSGPVIQGLKSLGVWARFTSPNSLQINNRKISGMAACIKRRAILCNGTLLVNTNLNVLQEICAPKHKAIVKKEEIEVTSFQRELNKYIQISDVTEAITKGFSKYGIRLEKKELTAREEALARELYDNKYSLFTWNFML